MNKLILKRTALFLIVLSLVFLLYLTKDAEAVEKLIYYSFLPEAPVYVHGIDVGQGAATLIKTDKKTVLIDTGEESEFLRLYDYLKGEKVDKIDLLFITHPHSDHFGGAARLSEKVEIERAFIPAVPDDFRDVIWEDTLSTLSQNGVEIYTSEEKAIFPLGRGAELELLGPFLKDAGNLNDLSLCFKLKCGDMSVLITGDGEKKAEKALLKEDIDADVLFSGHHGSKTSANDFFLERVTPSVSLISVGCDNSHGLPDRVHVEGLLKYGDVFRTDLDGSVVFLVYEDEIKAVAEKQRG